MDPLTQGVLGASLPQATAKPQRIIYAGILGLLAGMAPDLDVLIRSNADPLLFLEYHRQFTHSLFFIPIGGIICAAVLYIALGKRWGLSFKEVCVYCTLGYATHALLDACTTYGTQLLWPFSAQRFAWNTVSVIDPLYTLPLLLLIVGASVRRSNTLAKIALVWALTYPIIGLIQRDRAMTAGWELAKQRNHTPLRLEAKPSFANLLVWKTVYETPQHFYVDAVRTGSKITLYPGERIEKLNINRDFPWLLPDSQQAKDIERFRWFSNGYVAKDPTNEFRIIDVRYSIVPNQIKALWSIALSPSAQVDQHVDYLVHRNVSERMRKIFFDMLLDL